MELYWPLLAGLSALGIYSSARRREWYPITKTLPIWTLLISLVLTFHASLFWVGTLIGLVFGLIGDICLLKDAKKIWFLLGLVAFLIGHLGYAHSFLVVEWALSAEFLMAYTCFVLLYGNILSYKLFKSEFLVPVMVYYAVMSMMGVSAFNFDAALMQRAAEFNATPAGAAAQHVHLPLASIGVILFIISDSFICWNKFIVSVPHANILVLTSYYPAQALLVHGAILSLQHPMAQNLQATGSESAFNLMMNGGISFWPFSDYL